MPGRRLFLTTRGVAALAPSPVFAVGGILLGAEELVLVAIALLALVLCGLLQSAHRYAHARGNWRVTAQLARSDAEIGSRHDMVVTLATAGRGGATPVWLEDPQCGWARAGRTAQPMPRWSRLPNPSRAVRVPELESGAIVSLAFPLPTARRGVYALSGSRLWCLDSFGLVAQLVAAGPRATVTVHPVPVLVEVAEQLLRGDPRAEESRPRAPVAPRRDSLGDFSGIRPYVPGDRLRLLYWPALARTGELMVRDFEESGPHRVQLILDVRPSLGDAGRERVLATAAGVGLGVLAHRSVVELSTTAGERVAVGPGPIGEIALLRAIAAIETDPPLSSPRWRARRRLRPRGPSVRVLPATTGAALVVTTADGARDLPGSLGFAHLVIAP